MPERSRTYERRRRAMIIAAVVAIGPDLISLAHAMAGEPAVTAAPQVSVIRVGNACFADTVRATGFIVARQEAVVNLDVPGFSVVEILAKEGDRVSSAQVLARLTRQSTDGADVPAAAAAQASTSATLKAPAAGLITRSTAVIGATASPVQSEPLFRIAAGNEIELEVEVPSVHALELRPGQTARVELENGRELIGRVRLAPAEIDPRTQLGRARISLEADPPVPIGMLGRAAISASRSCGLTVPTSALLYRRGGTRLQVVRDATITFVSVQVGLHSDSETEIVHGLSEGDVIVANGGASLREGDKITAVYGNDAQRDGQ